MKRSIEQSPRPGAPARGALLRGALLLGALLLGALLLGGCVDQQEWAGLQVGDPAPAYASVTLEGDSLSLADLRGEVVLLNVWATWCAPCRKEMPGLQELHRRYGDRGLRVVGASVDSRHARRQIEGFLEDEGITYTILLDPGERVARAFRTIGVPETFLIDKEGRVAWQLRGLFDPVDDAFVARVEGLLGDS